MVTGINKAVVQQELNMLPGIKWLQKKMVVAAESDGCIFNENLENCNSKFGSRLVFTILCYFVSHWSQVLHLSHMSHLSHTQGL
jgi:hypothetical protein